MWEKVGGWSEEFFPTGGDDSDFNMKLWRENVRIFKGIGSAWFIILDLLLLEKR